MSKQDSNRSKAVGKSSKSSKPYDDFPLFPHATKRWAKKIRGKMHYFGPWDNPDAALDKYLEQRDALHAGRRPRDTSEGVTVKGLCNRFLESKDALVKSGELTQRSWNEYKAAGKLCISCFGEDLLVEDMDQDDFGRLRKRMVGNGWGPVAIGNVIQRVRVIFKFAGDNALIDRPVRYGQNFKRPSRKTVRIERAKRGPKLLTADEINRLLDSASSAIKAMTLLGINCGFGNADCGHLRLSAVDLDAAMIDFPRPKTGISRRCPLWSETVEAIREASKDRPTPKNSDHSRLVFIAKYGRPWTKDTTDQTVGKPFGKLLRDLNINGRKRLGFYTLRHTFRTVADESKDQQAVDFIMGHEVPHKWSVYRERISDERLKAVADHVRAWLFGPVLH
jgi:integrase